MSDTCEHGRPDHIELIQQLAVALHGDRMPARAETPEQVWTELIDEVAALRIDAILEP